jgi:hypothetical protein
MARNHFVSTWPWSRSDLKITEPMANAHRIDLVLFIFPCPWRYAAKHLPEAGQTERTDFHSRLNELPKRNPRKRDIRVPACCSLHNEVMQIARGRAGGEIRDPLIVSRSALPSPLLAPRKAAYIMISPALYFHLLSPNLPEKHPPPVHVRPKPALAYDADAPSHFGRVRAPCP